MKKIDIFSAENYGFTRHKVTCFQCWNIQWAWLPMQSSLPCTAQLPTFSAEKYGVKWHAFRAEKYGVTQRFMVKTSYFSALKKFMQSLWHFMVKMSISAGFRRKFFHQGKLNLLWRNNKKSKTLLIIVKVLSFWFISSVFEIFSLF